MAHSPHILVVDDDRSCSALLVGALVRHGYDVDVASDGFMALELASRHIYDLALFDYQMPGMTGVELFRKMRHLQPDVRGVLQTSHTRSEIITPAMSSGAERVLAKPVDTTELLAIVESLVGSP